ncbi:MAG TPA: serine/threonine-protein kinase, partial [Haliangium sp.]|nr:serine/threonine-protein kinase [Haliangium sp.]
MAHDKYRLAERLGSGGMADVFRAEITGAEGFSRPVAIKRLHAGVSADSDFCAMFVREARLLATLQHPNIVSVLDFEWDAEGRLFLVMELVAGINLAQLVHRGELPVPAALYIVAEVLRGLGHAHGRGILHRDVTPHNVLLAWTG